MPPGAGQQQACFGDDRAESSRRQKTALPGVEPAENAGSRTGSGSTKMLDHGLEWLHTTVDERLLKL